MLAVVLDLPLAFVKDDKILRSRHINHLDETSYGQTGGAFPPPELLFTHRAQVIYCAHEAPWAICVSVVRWFETLSAFWSGGSGSLGYGLNYAAFS